MGDPKERPILFSAPMVRAILAGQKTVTRRLVRWRVQGFGGGRSEPSDHPVAPTYEPRGGHTVVHTHPDGSLCGMPVLRTPAMPGDRLWVRETFLWHGKCRCTHPEGRMEADDPKYWKWDGWTPGKIISVDRCVRYAADGAAPTEPTNESDYFWRKMPSIHMPRWASRITLDVVDVRVERLHAIDDADAVREGVMTVESSLPPHERFASLWDTINGERAPWASNPWVWRISFDRVTP